ncbi:hypothetical protein MGLY_25340 [Neomoorella glycerini]|uniref:Uncharacterized protein n=1 Tax=Neomoorella glycerini TaxID=55779 RepID=A0A6I5ZU40_9FIRM|nr:hypothetical protein [Moorella glycerini]QGP93135.1 hypothetical protein MGLY_25340 [Moorella glycerini]
MKTRKHLKEQQVPGAVFPPVYRVKQDLFLRPPDQRFEQCPETLQVKFGLEVKGCHGAQFFHYITQIFPGTAVYSNEL